MAKKLLFTQKQHITNKKTLKTKTQRMKRLLLPSLLVLTMTLQAFADKGPAYNIKIKIDGLRDTMVYIAHYMGDNTYLADSVRCDKKGLAVFKRDTALECGIYMVAVNRIKLFEFIVSEQEFSLETDTADFIMHMKIKNSKENEIFFEFQKFTTNLGIEEVVLRKNLDLWKDDKSKKDTIEKINAYIKGIPAQVYNYRLDFIKKYPNSVIGQVFLSIKEPDVPPAPTDSLGNILDSNWQYRYYLEHFWDNVNFTSGCVVRSPVFQPKLTLYMDKVTIQHPDSVFNSCSRVLDRAKANKEVYRFTLQHLMTKYEKSQFICMDAVPVRLAIKYYTYKDCWWLDSTTIYRTRANAETYLPTLCNLYAPPLEMYDSNLQRKISKIVDTDTNETTRGYKLGELLELEKKKIVRMYDLKTDYTVVIFWDPDCGHCKKELPVIKQFYDTVKARGVEVYAIGVEQDVEKWIQYVRDNQLKWINVTDPYNLSRFRSSYNINSTPQIFLLDKEKKIIAKRLGAEQLKEILYKDLGIPYTAPPSDKKGEDGTHDEHDGHGH